MPGLTAEQLRERSARDAIATWRLSGRDEDMRRRALAVADRVLDEAVRGALRVELEQAAPAPPAVHEVAGEQDQDLEDVLRTLLILGESRAAARQPVPLTPAEARQRLREGQAARRRVRAGHAA